MDLEIEQACTSNRFSIHWTLQSIVEDMHARTLEKIGSQIAALPLLYLKARLHVLLPTPKSRQMWRLTSSGIWRTQKVLCATYGDRRLAMQLWTMKCDAAIRQIRVCS